jgi:hypothetical protein
VRSLRQATVGWSSFRESDVSEAHQIRPPDVDGPQDLSEPRSYSSLLVLRVFWQMELMGCLGRLSCNFYPPRSERYSKESRGKWHKEM